MAELVIGKQFCPLCGAEVTRFGIYPYGIHGGKYCYDCVQLMKAEKYTPRKKQKGKKKISPLGKQAKYLHNKGYKPSKIAEMLHITTKEVYDFLNA